MNNRHPQSRIPSTGPRASMAGFQSADQLRRDATPNRMRTVMGPGGSGELETARRALWICCFHAEDSPDPVARTDNWSSPGEAPTWAAVCGGDCRGSSVALTSEHRVEALGADAPGNAQQVVVKVAAAA